MRKSSHIGTPRTICAFVAVATVAAVFTSALSPAATSSSVVGATVLQATMIDASLCKSGTPDVTDFGGVLPGTTTITGTDCAVTFGSSNTLAQLRIRQSDSLGDAMFSPTRGVLDDSFDIDGRAQVPVGLAAATDVALGVTTQLDGKTVTTGLCDMGASSFDICLTRFNVDGSLDTSFDGDGIVTATGGVAGGHIDEGDDVRVLPDGKVLTAGYCSIGSDEDLCLLRFNANGMPDASFGTSGLIKTGTNPGFNGAVPVYSMTLQNDGKIVVAGNTDWGSGGGYDVWVGRYNPDGSPDPWFDGDGQLATASAPGGNADYADAVAIQADGKIVVSGHCQMGGGATGWDFCLHRYDPDGALDASFDGDGRVITAFGAGAETDAALGVAIQADGKIVAAGFCNNAATGDDICVARYNADGSLDGSFDGDGKVSTTVGPGAGVDRGQDVAIQDDGGIVVTGRCNMGAVTGEDVCILRYASNGTLDSTFGTSGLVTTATSAGAGSDRSYEVDMQPDGRMTVVGRCDMGAATGRDICLSSYDQHGFVSQYVDDGTSDFDTAGTAINAFAACLRSVSGGASAQWSAGATCPGADGGYWNDVPATSQLVAYTSAFEPNPPDATANFRFGLRTSNAQNPGKYVAPISFEVIAP